MLSASTRNYSYNAGSVCITSGRQTVKQTSGHRGSIKMLFFPLFIINNQNAVVSNKTFYSNTKRVSSVIVLVTCNMRKNVMGHFGRLMNSAVLVFFFCLIRKLPIPYTSPSPPSGIMDTSPHLHLLKRSCSKFIACIYACRL